jgi:hypothetical protein
VPDISLDLRAIEFVTEHNVRVFAWRAFVDVEFAVGRDQNTRFECFVDPGAPFSVIPFSLWHDRNLQWSRLGSQISRVSGASASPLSWQGAPCVLGEVSIQLQDKPSGRITGPHRVVAKFPRTRLPTSSENATILGMNFLADNDIRLTIDSNDGQLSGFLSVP